MTHLGTFLLYFATWCPFLAFIVAQWVSRRRYNLVVAARFTEEYVAAAASVLGDADMPASIKEAMRRWSPLIDNKELVRRLADEARRGELYKPNIAGGSISGSDFERLTAEQRHNCAKAIMFFLLALSYWHGRVGRPLREAIMTNDADRKVSPAVLRFMEKSEPTFSHA